MHVRVVGDDVDGPAVFGATTLRDGHAASETKEAGGGYWRVSPRDAADGTPGILFSVQAAGCPLEQLQLKSAVERTLSAIRSIYASEDSADKLQEAVAKLVSLAQVGLVGKKPATDVATHALIALQSEIVEREAGPVKNAYMKKLGGWALFFAFCSAVIFVVVKTTPSLSPVVAVKYSNICLVWMGCMGGAWASFASRKVDLGFFDLVALEEDRIEPWLRLIFAGTLTTILMLVFVTGMADIQVGQFEASHFESSGSVALLTGAFAGLAEKALPSAMLARANSVISSTKD